MPLPWVAILRHAPAFLAAADALFTRKKFNRVKDPTRPVEARLDDLAEETQNLARQTQALALASQAAARRARFTSAVAVLALVLATVALIVAMSR